MTRKEALQDLLAEARADGIREALKAARRKVQSCQSCASVELDITALLDTPAPAIRCAECDCTHGGADCNWIAQPEVTVQQAAKIIYEYLDNTYEDMPYIEATQLKEKQYREWQTWLYAQDHLRALAGETP